MTEPPSDRRLDRFLVEAGHFETRARAQAAIRAGLIRIDGAVAKKPSQTVAPGAQLSVEGEAHPFVSRGGVKLQAGLKAFGVAPQGLVCLDLGASTGGFTDVLLRGGAAKVFAVDVGTGQLHQRIAGDERVINLEKTHARDLTRALAPASLDLITCDVSFISIRKALPPALALAGRGARLITLVKPQFEVGREGLGKGGLVRPGLARPAADAVADWIETQGWRPLGLIESPIKGGDGNEEFLLAAAKKDQP
ncbi:MAG: TlyA family RNA methyltransferase [Pseudomonadota bacterium]